ncbi:MAG: gluconolactonase [Rhizobium sp.]|nr:gluconolactonase [Rhizobium sp.]
MTHEVLDPEFLDLVDPNATVRQEGTGFIFTEGPVWHPLGQHLLFSDMPGDVRRKLDRNGVTEIARPSNKGNGQTFDAGLNLVVCEHATSSVVRITPNWRREVLASHFEGRELNSPNDLCIRSDGSIYFSDPWYGRMPGFGVERPRQLGWQGVFRIPPGGSPEPELVVGRYLFTQPNGLCFSPDETLLYINDTDQANIRVFDVRPDGALSEGRLFATNIRDAGKAGLPDGMKCDETGNVWVTGPGGIWVFNPQGKLIGKLVIPEEAANLHWGGSDWHTLYVCATTSVYSIDTKVGPRREPFMSASVPRSHRSEVNTMANPASLDASRIALVIQDMQNDVVMEGGAFAASGSPQHCREQNAIANIAALADRCRQIGIPVIHVWFLVDPGAPGLTLNAPLFEGVVDNSAVVRGTWGAQPVPGLERQPGDHVVEKMRMSAWEGTNLETILKATARDMVIVTGAWTNMSIEHTARTGADKGFVMVVPEDCCSTMNADWHNASINYALQNVSAVTKIRDLLDSLN